MEGAKQDAPELQTKPSCDSGIDGEFAVDDVDGCWVRVEQGTDSRLVVLNDRLDSVDERLAQLHGRLSGIDGRLGDSIARTEQLLADLATTLGSIRAQLDGLTRGAPTLYV